MTDSDSPGESRSPSSSQYSVAGVRALYAMAITMGISRAFHHDATVLPVLIRQLAEAKVYAGLFAAIFAVGLFVPQLAGAYIAHHLTRVKPFIFFCLLGLLATVFGFSGVSFLAKDHPDTALILILVLTLPLAGCVGLAMPGQMVLIGKIVRPSRRGVFFGNETFFMTLAGMAGGFGLEAILDALPFPNNFGVSFLADSWFLILGIAVFLTIREQPSEPAPAHGSFGSYLKRMPELCRENPPFAWFLVPRILMAVANVLCAAMIPIYCLEAFPDQFTEADAGRFAAFFMLGQCSAAPLLGRFGSRQGFGKVMCFTTGCQAVRLVLLMAVPAEFARPVVFFTFFLGGVFLTGLMVGTRNLILNFSTPDERPAYVAITNAIRAPFLVVASILGGVLVDAFSYSLNFSLSALSAVAAIIIFVWKVRDPGPEDEGAEEYDAE